MQSKAIRQEDRGWRAPAQGDQSDALRRTQTHSVAPRRAQSHTDALRRAQMHSDALRRAYLLNAIEHPLRWQWQSDSLKVLTSSMRLSIHSICTIWLGSIGVYLAFLLPSSKQSMSLAT